MVVGHKVRCNLIVNRVDLLKTMFGLKCLVLAFGDHDGNEQKWCKKSDANKMYFSLIISIPFVVSPFRVLFI